MTDVRDNRLTALVDTDRLHLVQGERGSEGRLLWIASSADNNLIAGLDL